MFPYFRVFPAILGGALSKSFSRKDTATVPSVHGPVAHVIRRLALLIPCFSLLTAHADAAAVVAATLSWNAAPESDIARYELSYGTSPGNHNKVVDAGPNVSTRVSDLVLGVTYYFAVKAINTAGVKGPASREVAYVANLADPFPTNLPPSAQAASASTAYQTAVLVPLSALDPEGLPLVFSTVTQPLHGTLSGIGTGTPLYTPDQGFSGSDSFTYHVSDGTSFSSNATVSLSVAPAPGVEQPVNSSPRFTSLPYGNITEDVFYPSRVLAVDADPGDTLTYSKISGPAWLTVYSNGTVQGTPGNGDVGPNEFQIMVVDSSGAITTATVRFTVINANDPPSFGGSNLTAGKELVPYSATSIAWAAGDPDLGDRLTFSKISGPAWLEVASDGSLSGTPPKGSAGEFAITVRATDLAGAWADAIFKLRIDTNTALPLPWNLTTLGSGNLPADAQFTSGTYTLSGSGPLAPLEDNSAFTWQTLSGNGEICARIANLQNTGTATTLGIMIRESLAPNARQAFIGLDGSGKTQWIRRLKPATASVKTTLKLVQTANPWLRLNRTGNTFTAYTSSTGSTWTKAAKPITLALPPNCYIGLSLSSGNKATLNTSQLSNARVTP